MILYAVFKLIWCCKYYISYTGWITFVTFMAISVTNSAGRKIYDYLHVYSSLVFYWYLFTTIDN